MPAPIMPTMQGTALALDPLVSNLLALKLAQRDALPHASNGRPVAPSDAYARRVLKDMGAEKSQEIRRLLATDLCAIHDGVRLPIVKAWLRRYDAILDTCAGDYKPRQMVALHRAETRGQSLLDLAQLRTAADENDVEALERQAGEIASYRAVLDELAYETDRKLALLLGAATFAPHPATPFGPSLVRIK